MEEIIDETLELEEDEELEDEADAEVEAVLFDLTNGKLGQAGSVKTELPVSFPRLVMVLSPLTHILYRLSPCSVMRKQRDRWISTAPNWKDC